MKFIDSVGTLPDAESLRLNIAGVDVTTLLITTAHITSDYSLLKEEWRPALHYGVATIELSPQELEHVRALCTEHLLAYQESGKALPPAPGYDEFHGIVRWLMGTADETIVSLAYEEVVTQDQDPRSPGWSKDNIAPGSDFSVAIIGAGESGLLTAYRLKQAGIPFVIFEKNDEVGGTWYENNYPGCCVDTNSFFYSYAFAKCLWSQYYAQAGEVLSYFKHIAEICGLYEHIRFNCEVTECRWNEADSKWELEVQGEEGPTRQSFNMLVSAVGQLNRPMMPNIPGQDAFAGTSFHSACWDHTADYKDKRVGVIGTGATALQIIPKLAKEAKEVKVFARTTPWLLPTPLLEEKVGSDVQWALEHLPYYAMWYRIILVAPGAVGMLDGVVVDPDFPPTELAVSAQNDAARKAVTQWIESQIDDRQDLQDFVVPNTPIGAKRVIRDNGRWIATLKRPNVTLVRERIESVTEDGLKCVDASDHDLDLIVYATGFKASKFLMPMKVIGRNGIDLHDMWDGDARAYLGMTVPNFPNLFVLYGPNTNQVVHGGSAIVWSEYSVKYVLDAARHLLLAKKGEMEVKESIYWKYNDRIDEANLLRTWGFSGVNSWYKNDKGRVTQNYPFSSAELWSRTHQIDPNDYIIA